MMKINFSGKGPQKKTWANFVGEVNFLKVITHMLPLYKIMCVHGTGNAD